jgi:cation diffusion facilitator CzcD-associated flavoprotein CzcO
MVEGTRTEAEGITNASIFSGRFPPWFTGGKERKTEMVESIETVIIGAGHAGLSTSYCLKQRGREHLVLEKASRPGNAWHSERWDSFTFVSPNWSFQIPGGEYDGPEPDGFMTREELVRRFEQYAEKYQLPIAYNQRVTAVLREDDQGYRVQTSEAEYRARNVVIANGWFQVGKKPPFANKLPPSILQLHSSEYRNPQSLPAGAVLVVGSGQSGGQIAEELYQSGRKVFLATGTAPHEVERMRSPCPRQDIAELQPELIRSLGHPERRSILEGWEGDLRRRYRGRDLVAEIVVAESQLIQQSGSKSMRPLCRDRVQVI